MFVLAGFELGIVLQGQRHPDLSLPRGVVDVRRVQSGDAGRQRGCCSSPACWSAPTHAAYWPAAWSWASPGS
ncbi:hypothetical protein ACPA9J_03480 [Pseudomonas aeruginosa]